MDDLKIQGVSLIPLKIIAGEQGDVLHAIKKDSMGYNGFGEAYFSSVIKGGVKGWKKHKEMTLNIIVPQGEIRFILFDDRDGSPSKGKFDEVKLSRNNFYRLTIPPMIWVAFQGLDDFNLLLNVADVMHNPGEGLSVSIGDPQIPFNDW